MMPVMNKKHAHSIASLLELLSERYFYKETYFSNRITYLTIPGNDAQEPNAVCLESYPGAPFILFVVSDGESPSSKLTEEAKQYVLSTESIGLLSFFSGTSKEITLYRRRFRDNGFDLITELEHYFKAQKENQGDTLTASEDGADHDGSADPSLLPIKNKVEDIFFDIHSVMRDVDGLHSDSALEELCKLLYLKCYVEEQASRLPLPLVHSSCFGNIEEFSGALRALYRDAINYDLRVFSLKIPAYERSRGVFSQPIYLSSAALVKAFQLIQNYSLTKSDTDLKGRAFQKVLNKSVRSGMGQYFTPSEVCRLIVDIVSPTTSDLILDPFCGSGHFLTECLKFVSDRSNTERKEFHEFAFGKLHGIEKSDRMTRVAMTDMRLSGDGHSNIRCTDALLDFRNYPDIKPNSFDLVLTNPPFGSILGSDAFSSLANFHLAKNRKKVPLEILGLERAIEFLSPGGKLAIVLPEGIFNAQSLSFVRDWLQERLSIRIIIDLPDTTFAPYGANVRSGILFGRKLLPGERVKQSEQNVCMIKLENIGYDASGRKRANADIKEVHKIAKDFLAEEGW